MPALLTIGGSSAKFRCARRRCRRMSKCACLASEPSRRRSFPRVGFQIAGKVIAIEADQGDFVKAGALLAKLDDDAQRAKLQQERSRTAAGGGESCQDPGPARARRNHLPAEEERQCTTADAGQPRERVAGSRRRCPSGGRDRAWRCQNHRGGHPGRRRAAGRRRLPASDRCGGSGAA